MFTHEKTVSLFTLCFHAHGTHDPQQLGKGEGKTQKSKEVLAALELVLAEAPNLPAYFL